MPCYLENRNSPQGTKTNLQPTPTTSPAGAESRTPLGKTAGLEKRHYILRQDFKFKVQYGTGGEGKESPSTFQPELWTL